MISNKYKILVIEDEDNINNLLKALLEASGYQVITAKNCQNGQTLFVSHRPDLVILDLGLPDFDGMTFLKEVRTEIRLMLWMAEQTIMYPSRSARKSLLQGFVLHLEIHDIAQKKADFPAVGLNRTV